MLGCDSSGDGADRPLLVQLREVTQGQRQKASIGEFTSVEEIKGTGRQ